MSDSVPTSPDDRDTQGSPGWLMVMYAASRRHMPGFVLTAVDNCGRVIRPAVSRLQSASLPVRKAISDGVIGAAEVWATLDFTGKVRLYATTICGWLAYSSDFPSFLKYIQACYKGQWSESLRGTVASLYSQLKTICRTEDVMYISAFLLSEGSQRLQDSLLAAWNIAPSPSSLLKSVEASFDSGPLTLSIREKIRIFSSLASMKAEISSRANSLRLRGRRMVSQAKDIASRTVFVLYHTADVAVDSSLRVVDERIVSWLTSPPREMNLRGEAHLFDMEARLRLELTHFLSSTQRTLVSSRVYTSVHDRLSAGLVVLRKAGAQVTEAIANAEWPEQVKSPIDSVLVFVGMGKVLRQFDKAVWRRLDQDQDGVVTLGDLFQTFSPISVLQSILRAYASLLSHTHRN